MVKDLRGAQMPQADFPKCVLPAINFKGGTGKTTVTIALAEGLCLLLRKRVIIVDCDFQCSASIALLGRKTLNHLISTNATLDCQVETQIGGTNDLFLRDAVVAARHCVREASQSMFVLPGSPDMPRRERQIISSFLAGGDIHSAYQRACTRLAESYCSLLQEFDLVLLDCPPGLTLFSEAALKAADGLIIPTLPNEISFASLDHLRSEIGRTRSDRTLEDLLVGTVISKLSDRTGSPHQRSQTASIERLLDRVALGFRILKPYLPYCRELESTTWRSDDAGLVDFARRYGQSAKPIIQLSEVIADRCRTLFAAYRTKGKASLSRVKCATS
jgi:chromosome partitioning protein